MPAAAVDDGMLQIDALNPSGAERLASFWLQAYRADTSALAAAPVPWAGDPSVLADVVRQHARAGRAVTAHLHGQVAGFMLYDIMPFHGEATAFVPVTGHLALGPRREAVCRALYNHLAGSWARDGVLNHFVCVLAGDRPLADELHRLGFGLYVVDCFQMSERLAGGGHTPTPDGIRIIRAGGDQAPDLVALDRSASAYYSQPPIFLVKEPLDDAAALARLEDPDRAFFMAYEGSVPVGFMGIAREGPPGREDPRTLAASNMTAYLLPGHRRRGLGEALLRRCGRWALERGMARVHVDFESANMHGHRFWPKHFTPLIHSLRRRLNQDAAR